MRSSSSAHRLQKWECPHGTSASGALGSSRHSSLTAGSAVATGGATSLDVADADDDDGGVVAANASSASYFQFHHRHCCLCPPVVRSVGCLSCGWLQTKIRTDCTRPLQTYRWKFWCACHSASLPSSLPVVSCGHVSTCYSLIQSLFFLLYWEYTDDCYMHT